MLALDPEGHGGGEQVGPWSAALPLPGRHEAGLDTRRPFVSRSLVRLGPPRRSRADLVLCHSSRPSNQRASVNGGDIDCQISRMCPATRAERINSIRKATIKTRAVVNTPFSSA